MELPLWLVAWTIYSAGFGATAVHVSNDGERFLSCLMWGAIWPVVAAAVMLDMIFEIARDMARGIVRLARAQAVDPDQ